MPLQKQNISVNLAKGLDTKTDSKLVSSNNLLELENAKFQKGGALQKRNGYIGTSSDYVDGSTSISTITGLATLNDELLAVDDNCLCSYAQNVDGWISKGQLASLDVTTQNIIKNSAQQTNPQTGFLNGTVVTAWEDSRGGVRATISLLADEQIVVGDTELSSTAVNCKVTTYAGKIWVYYVEGTNLKAVSVDPLNLAFSSATTVASDVNATNKVFDITTRGALGLIAYNNTAGDTKLAYLTSAPALGSPVTGQPTPVTHAIQSDESVLIYNHDDTYIHIFQSNGTNFYGTIYNTDFTTAVATVTIDTAVVDAIAVERIDATNLVLYTSQYNGAAPHNTTVETHDWDTSGSFTNNGILRRSVAVSSKGFTDSNGNFYVPVQHQSDLQSTSFIMDSSGEIIAKFLASETGAFFGSTKPLSEVIEVDTDRFLFAQTKKGKLISESGSIFTTVGVSNVTLDFSGGNPIQFEQLGESTQFTGGFIKGYDGSIVTEQNFHLYPENFTLAQSASGGSMSDGTYQVILLYEWTDARGQIHRSATSVAKSITLTGGGSSQEINVTFPCIALTEKDSISLVAYRTTDGGTIFYRATSVTTPALNDRTAISVAVDLTIDDTDLQGNELLYTTGGVLDNFPPPTASVITSFKNRVFLAGLENKNRIQYSKQYVVGEGVSYPAEFIIQLEDGGEEITALGVLDDKLIIFKETQSFALVGDGPLDTGLQNDFGTPTPIATRTGVAKDSPKSVVTTPLGVMYKSNKGIYLLDRSLVAKYIGAPVEEFNSEAILSSKLIADQNEVRFVTDGGRILVYNYYFNRWASYTTFTGATDSVVWDNQYVVSNSTQVLIESVGTFTDLGAAINQKVTTAWYQFATHQGFQKIKKAVLLGKFKGNHKLKVSIGYNFEDYYNEEIVIDTSTLFETGDFGDEVYGDEDPFGTSDLSVYQFELRPSRMRCQAIRFKIEDQYVSDRTEGFELTSLTFEVGVKKGTMRLGTGNTFTKG